MNIHATHAAPRPQAPARTGADYWTAGGERFQDLAEIGRAVEEGRLEMPRDGLRVACKGWQAEEAPRIRKQGLAALAVSAVGFAGGVALAAAASPVAIPALMVGLVGMGVAEGMRRAANDFESAPQIRSQGVLQAALDPATSETRLSYQSLQG